MQSFNDRQAGKTHFLFILIAIVAIGSGLLVQTSKSPPAKLPEFKKTILLPSPKSLGEIKFTDHNGDPFTEANLLDKWTILFFAFTNCPDVCPTTMQTLAQVKSKVSDAQAWDNYQVVMITVDPERDSPERLKSYVPYFDPEFVGLSAPVPYTTEFAKNVGILFFKGDVMENGGYDMDHGASLILVNPKGQYAGVITAPHRTDEISDDLIDLAKYAGLANNTSGQKSSNSTAPIIDQAIPAKANADLSISNAWIRPAPPTVKTMAAYFDVRNDSDQSITIVSASSPEFENAMIHKTSIKDGMASMDHMSGLTIPANSTIQLTPMGMHLMLMGAKKPLAKGNLATVILKTSEGQEIIQKIQVKPRIE